jgi:hypothetical protein
VPNWIATFLCRCRPLSNKELQNGEKSVFALENDSVCLTNPENGEVHRFGFDYIYGPDSLQTDLWNSVVSVCYKYLQR